MTKNLDIASAEGEFEVNVDPSVLSAIKQQVRGTPSKEAPDDVFTLRCKSRTGISWDIY